MKVAERKSDLRKPTLRAFTSWFMFSLILLAFISSCGHDDDKAREAITYTIDEFATHYFNFDFDGALNACTPESAKWLSFMSSNVLQEDVDILRVQDEGAWHETRDISMTSDTTATVTCKVFNFLKIDTLGRAGKMTEQAFYTIPLVKRDGKWLVKMEGLPQSERQNHD